MFFAAITITMITTSRAFLRILVFGEKLHRFDLLNKNDSKCVCLKVYRVTTAPVAIIYSPPLQNRLGVFFRDQMVSSVRG
jgi:hypothetical protein